MNINQTIYDAIKDHVYDRFLFYSEDIREFMLTKMDIESRQQASINLIETIMTAHGKKQLLHHVVLLAKVEKEIKKLEPWVRDHVVHALLCFILGIYIDEKFLTDFNVSPIDEFEWKIAGLFHDVGYPVQVANDLDKLYSATMNNITNELGSDSEVVYFQTVPKNFEKLTNNQNGFELIQGKLDSWGLSINAKEEFEKSINNGEICHGMLSALSVLKIIDSMYQKYNPTRKRSHSKDNIEWGQNIFESKVVSACSAIFIHNLPSDCFNDKKIDRNKAPLAFLLKLTDSLQDWSRSSKEKPLGIPSNHYEIEIKNKKLILHTTASDNRKDKIQNEIQSTLLADDIIIT